MNKWLWANVILLAANSPNLHAEIAKKTNAQVLEPVTSQQALNNNVKKLEAVAQQQGLPKQQIEQIDSKLSDLIEKTDFDSVEMLRRQEENIHQEDFKPIELDELEKLPIEPIDQNLANEILQVAEQAKQEAQSFKANTVQVTAQSKPDVMKNDIDQSDLTQAPVDIDQLIQTIHADREILVSENKSGRTLDLNENVDEGEGPIAKLNIFRRILNRIRPQKELDEAVAERIAVDVTGAPRPLADNIRAKLSSFTVEAYSDFNAAIPQLRTMSIQAAQAVGYYDASFKFEKLSENRVRVVVDPAKPVKVREQEIEFTGAGKNLAQLQVIRVLPDLEVNDIFHHGKYETTKSRINDAANNNGFFDSYWRLHDVLIERPQDHADINLKFETGERYKLDQVQFKMSDPSKKLPIKESILKTLAPWQEGADYTAWRVNVLANNLTNSRYFNYSLVDAVKPDPIIKPMELAPDLQALVDQNQIDQNLLLSQTENNKTKKLSAPGDQAQPATDEKQFAGFVEQQSLSSSRLAERQIDEKEKENERLQAKAREERLIPVIVTLNADKLNSVEAGIGYGTDTGVRLRSQYRRAIVNERGHSFDANMELSQIRQSIDGRYNIPYKHPLNDYISLVGGYEREDRQDIGNGLNLVVESAVAGADRIIKGAQREWQHIFGLRYRLDRMTTEGAMPNAVNPNLNWNKIPDFVTATGNSEQQSLMLGYEATKVTSDNRINPTNGFKQNYKIQLGSRSLLSDANMAIVNANWKFLYSLGENNDHQFIGGANLGYIFTDDFGKVPYNLRFFEGGDQSLRGFDYKSLSPISSGYKVGGQARAIGTVEYNYQFKDGWRGAVFSDFGNAYDERFTNKTEYNIGIGIRWNSPIGPIRLDVASGISDPNKPMRLHFFIGSQL